MVDDNYVSDSTATLRPEIICPGTDMLNSLIFGKLPPSAISIFTTNMGDTLMWIISVTFVYTLYFNTGSHTEKLLTQDVVLKLLDRPP